MTARGPALAIAISSAAGILSCRAPRPPEAVLLVTLDTTRADRLGCYGYAKGETPALDALAGAGTLFERAVAPVPVTLPSHCSMLTGLNPCHHGVRYNGIHVLMPRVTTLAERLRDAGFATGAVVSSFTVARRFGLDQGFGSYDDPFEGRTAVDLDWLVERRAVATIDKAIAWWDAHPSGKRFLWVHLYDPHYPYDPPFPYSARFKDSPYDGEIASVDHELRRLFDDLRRRGDWNTALIVVAGDHGEGLYEHGERWHASQVYESTLHVPLIVKAPDAPRGRRVVEPVGLVDITPTILDLVGVKTADALDGVSLRAALDTGRAPRRSIYFECIADAILYGWSPLLGVRRGGMKYFEGARGELYDLDRDPREADDLAKRDPQRAADLRADLEGFRKIADIGGAGVEAQQAMDEETAAQLASLGYVGGVAAAPASAAGGVHPPDMVDLEQEMLRAQTAVGEKRWEELADSLDFILRRDPTNRFALYYRSVTYARTGDLPKAIEVARALLGIYPDAAEGYDLLGESLSAAGKPGDSAQVYAEALAKHPDNARLRFHRVLALLEARRVDDAEAEVARLEKDRPSQPTTPLSRSMIAAMRGHVPAALDALEAAVSLGLHDLGAVATSSWFAEVRKDARYAGIAARASRPARSTPAPVVAPGS